MKTLERYEDAAGEVHSRLVCDACEVEIACCCSSSRGHMVLFSRCIPCCQALDYSWYSTPVGVEPDVLGNWRAVSYRRRHAARRAA